MASASQVLAGFKLHVQATADRGAGTKQADEDSLIMTWGFLAVACRFLGCVCRCTAWLCSSNMHLPDWAGNMSGLQNPGRHKPMQGLLHPGRLVG